MSEKKLKAPLEVIKKASQALQTSKVSLESLAKTLQLPLQTVQDFFAGEAIEQAIALQICKKLNILPQSGRTPAPGVNPNPGATKMPNAQAAVKSVEKPREKKLEKPPELPKRDRSNFLPDDPLLDEVFATSDSELDDDLKFEILPDFQPISSIPSPTGFMLLTDPDEDDLGMAMQPLTAPIVYRHEVSSQSLTAPSFQAPAQTLASIPNPAINQDLQDYQDHLQELVTELRDRLRDYTNARCGKIRILSMSKALPLAEIYTEPKVWQELPSDRWLGITDLEVAYAPKFLLFQQLSGGFVSAATEELLPIMDVLNLHSHLLIFGGLGSGKTTLLKYLAEECLAGKWCAQLVPVFLELRSLAYSKLEFTEFLIQNLVKISGVDITVVITLLKEGKFLLLLDGLETVPKTELHRITQEIGDFAALYSGNAIAITSRMTLATAQLQQFDRVELADFDREQIETFAKKWFAVSEGLAERAEPLLHQITGDRRLLEVTANPLCLTLACLAYGHSDFFVLDLFRESLQLLLKQWQESQAIYPTDSGSKLSTAQKWQILAEFAFKTTEQNRYFFSDSQLQLQLQDLILHQTDFSYQFCDLELLIEELCWQHGLLRTYARGIYGFAQPIWQEYLAAKWVSSNPSAMEQMLKYVDRASWHSIFIFVAGILPNSDSYLRSLKQAIDGLVANDSEIKRYLEWANQQASSLKAQYKPVVIRAMYCDVDFEKMRVLDRNRALQIAHQQSLERARLRSLGTETDTDTDTAFDVNRAMDEAIQLDLAMDFSKQRILSLARLLEPKMDRRLGWLVGQIPDPKANKAKFMKWWQSQGGEWAKNLRETILQYRKTIKDWNFTESQLALLRRYHYANTLLIECLNNSRQASNKVHLEIEENLLKLP
jgi:predicted NACHT family NTPase